MNLTIVEQKRKKCALFVYLGIGLLLLSFIFFFLTSLSYVAQVIFIILGIITILSGLILLTIGNVQFSRLSKEFKENYVKKAIMEKYPGCIFDPNQGVSYEATQQSFIVPHGDRFNSSDLISGKIEDVSFLTSDCRTEQMRTYTDSKGHTHTEWVTVFLGRFFMFEFNKNFVGNLIVSENTGNFPSLYNFEKIKMESIDFNKMFKTYTTNDETAFYILTPHIMEKLMAIQNKYKGFCSFSFIDNIMYFSLYNNIDTFELRLNKKIDEKFLNSLGDDIQTMKEIVDELKLNVNIFKK